MAFFFCALIVVQEAASKKSNNLLLDTSDLAISQYSLLAQTPPLSAPGSPAVQPRHSSGDEVQSANKEAAPVDEDQNQTPDACPQSDAELREDTKCDPSPAQPSDPSPSLQSPVIVVTQQFDEPENRGGQGLKETNEEDKTGGEAESDTTAVESSNTEEAVTQEVDATASGSGARKSSDPAPFVLVHTTEAQTESTPTAEPTSAENQVTPELSTSDQTSDHASEESPLPPQSPGTDSPMKISLGTLSEAIAPSYMEPVVQQTTDRAVYLSGQIKDNWEVERVKEENQREASENEENEARGEERDGGQQEGVAPTGRDSSSTSSASAAESPSVSTPQLTVKKEGLDDDQTEGTIPNGAEVEAAEGGEHAEEKENQDQENGEDLQSCQPTESNVEMDPDPLDSVSIIRDLVTAVIEVETIISLCESSSGPPST